MLKTRSTTIALAVAVAVLGSPLGVPAVMTKERH
jgi:hypothetical protein